MIDIAQEIVIYPTKSSPLTFILPFPTHHIKLLCKFATNKKSYLKEREQGISTKGMKREKQKKVFNDHLYFFGLVMSYWVNDECNKEEINHFKKELYILFKKSATVNGISSNLWREEVNEEIA